MAEADLQRFLKKVRDLRAFVAASEADPALRQRLSDCGNHQEVVDLAAAQGFEIGRRWGELGASQSGENSLLAGPAPASGHESVSVLWQGPLWRLERIHSCAASSPEGFWYDQAEHEWVCLLQGQARLSFEDEEGSRSLNRGDQLYIAPHRRHRIENTDGGSGTIWLALFWWEASPCPPTLSS
jgi:cupin 2 domain-containing protein